MIGTREESINWYQEPSRTEYIGDPFASWCGVPIKLDETIIGVIAAFDSERDNLFKESDKGVLEYLATQIATALKKQ